MATKKADAANVAAAAAAASSSSSPLTRAAAVALPSPLLLSVGAALCKAL